MIIISRETEDNIYFCFYLHLVTHFYQKWLRSEEKHESFSATGLQ